MKTVTKEDLDAYIVSIGGLKNAWSSDPNNLIQSSDNFLIAPGWYGLVKKLIEDLIALGWNKEIFDVEEKFGGLRFSINGGTKEMLERIEKAENDSYTICEICGKQGKPRDGRWIRTLCDFHYNFYKIGN